MKSQASNGVVKKRPQVCETAWRSSVRHGREDLLVQAEAVVTV